MKDEISNSDIKLLLERILTRFENWRVEVETNPNPHIVHQLQNIVTIVDNVSSVIEEKEVFSYKQLAKQMSILVQNVANLNTLITTSLDEDDFLDEQEEIQIRKMLMEMIESALSMIQLVQKSFGSPHSPILTSGLNNLLPNPDTEKH